MGQNLRDRVIVITGASSGIGAATALACAREGMHVALGARRIEKLEAVRKQIEAMGREAICVKCDVDGDDDVHNLFVETLAKLGRVDVAFANAGYGLRANVADTSDQQMRAIFETNFFGTWRVIREAMPLFKRQKSGHLIINSSAVSEVSPPEYGAYSATKAAQDALAGSLRAEAAHDGIFVTTVHPIGTKSEFFGSVRSNAETLGAPPNTPAMFMQTPEYVAYRIVKAMKKNRPTPEVWPKDTAKIAMAASTLFPGLSAWILRKTYRDIVHSEQKKAAAAQGSQTTPKPATQEARA